MNAEVLAEIEPEISYEDAPLDREASLDEFPCENKLGFTALCASCYLVKFLGDCPKNIRERAAEANETIAIDEDPFLPVFDTDIFPEYQPFTFDEPLSEATVIEEPILASVSREIQPGAVETAPTKPATSEDHIVLEQAPAAQPERETTRNYRDLLFDESIEFVVAAPRPMVKRTTEEVQPIATESIAVVETIVSPDVETVIPEPEILPAFVYTEKHDESIVVEPTLELTVEPVVFVEPEPVFTSSPRQPVVEAVAPIITPVKEQNLEQNLPTAPLASTVEPITVPQHQEENYSEDIFEEFSIPDLPVDSLEEKSNVYTFDFSVEEGAELDTEPLIEVTPPSVQANERDNSEDVIDATFLNVYEEQEVDLTTETISKEENEIASDVTDEPSRLRTPERLTPILQTYTGVPFRYARSFIGVFALLTLVFVDHSS